MIPIPFLLFLSSCLWSLFLNRVFLVLTPIRASPGGNPEVLRQTAECSLARELSPARAGVLGTVNSLHGLFLPRKPGAHRLRGAAPGPFPGGCRGAEWQIQPVSRVPRGTQHGSRPSATGGGGCLVPHVSGRVGRFFWLGFRLPLLFLKCNLDVRSSVA